MQEDHSALSTPKKIKSGKKQKNNKNPYANIGRDKFSLVLSELESKKEKIIAQTGCKGDTVVGFKYKNSKEWIPIVVRPKEEPQRGGETNKNTVAPLLQIREASEVVKKPKDIASKKKDSERLDNCEQDLHTRPIARVQQALTQECEDIVHKCKELDRKVKKLRFSWNVHYWDVVLILVLACLIFGNVFAILCITMFWYALPIMKDANGNLKFLTKARAPPFSRSSSSSSSSSSQGKKIDGGKKKTAKNDDAGRVPITRSIEVRKKNKKINSV